MADDRFDISLAADYEKPPQRGGASSPSTPGSAAGSDAGSAADRPFVGIEFACCRVYARVYINAAGTAFQGRCPRCAKHVTLHISADGQPGTFFTVS